MNNKEKYTALLEAIFDNAISIKDIAVLILKESLKKEDQNKKMTLVAFSENFLFAFLDEIGKIHLLIQQYPQKIDTIKFSSIGFRDHNKKLEAINKIVGIIPEFNTNQIVNILRQFKYDTLFIDYKNGKIIKPSDSITIRNDNLINYIKFIEKLKEATKTKLDQFKLTA